MGLEGTIAAVTDTEPVLHLSQIGQIVTLRLFAPLIVSDWVRVELERHRVWDELASAIGANLRVEIVTVQEIEAFRTEAGLRATLSDADASVGVLARRYPNAVVLTDDLPLRKALERQGVTVVGSIGVLFRAYAEGLLNKSALKQAIEQLFTGSSLYLSEGLKRRVLKRLHPLNG